MPNLPRQHVQPLLKFLNGQSRPNATNPPFDPSDVTAPPIDSSDDEGNDGRAPTISRHAIVPDFIDSSDDDALFGAADLTKTDFRPTPLTITRSESASAKHASSEKKGTSFEASQGSTQKRATSRTVSTNSKKRTRDVVDDVEATDNDTVAHNKRPQPKEDSSSAALGNQMDDGWFFEKRKKKSTVKGYGSGKAVKTRSATHLSNSLARNASQTPEQRIFRVPKELDVSSQSPQTQMEIPRTLRSDDSDSPLTSPPSSPSSDPPRPLQTSAKKHKVSSYRSKKERSRQKKRYELPHATESPEPEFRMPVAYGNYMPDAALPQLVLSPTNSPSKSTVVEPDKIICPICEDLVDEELLQTFSKGLKMDVARQAKFCRLHKKKSAEQIWEAKGYPNIEWSELKGRIERHHDHIKSLIAGKASETHFGSLLMEKIKSGQNRTLLKTDDYLSPGYYGLRGMSLMTETIVEMFSALLRKRAPQDKLISARGYSGFVQAVLVPELAVMLIQEDMSLSAEKARGVMQDSRAVGEALCDETTSRIQSRLQDLDAGLGIIEQAQKTKPKTNGDATEAPVMLKIQEIAESDSESGLSSIASFGGKCPTKGKQDKEKADIIGLDVDDSALRTVVAKSNKHQIKSKQDKVEATNIGLDDSDSGLSSICSLGAKRPEKSKQAKVEANDVGTGDSDSDLSSIASPADEQQTTEKQDGPSIVSLAMKDSDSELSSLDDL